MSPYLSFLLFFPMGLLSVQLDLKSSKGKGPFPQAHRGASTSICQSIRHGENMRIVKMCKVVLMFNCKIISSNKRSIKFSFNLCSRNVFYFLYEFRGGKELEWQKSQLKENHFQKPYLGSWRTWPMPLGPLYSLYGTVLTQKI